MVHIRIEQLAPRLGCLKENLDTHLELLKKAHADKIDLLLFPELSLTGYLLKDLVSDIALTEEELLDHLSNRTGGINNLEAVIGFVEETAGHRFHNSAAFLRWDETGHLELVHLHRKVYLPTYGLFDEGRYFCEGKTIRTFVSKSLGRCGLLVCEDAWHLSVPLLMAIDGPHLEGANVLFILSNSPARGVAMKPQPSLKGVPESHQTWETLLHTYASLLEVLVVYVNRGGVEDGLTFSGGSQVVAAGGECLGKADLLKADTLDVAIAWPEVLRASRIGSLVSASENADLLHRELHRILEGA